MPEMVQVVSTSIDAVGFDPVSAELWVRFVTGTTYVYSGVPEPVFDEFLLAESKGRYFNGEIRDTYPFRQAEVT